MKPPEKTAILVFLLAAGAAWPAWGEVLELVTYYPTSSSTGDLCLNSLVVTSNCTAAAAPGSGGAFIQTRVAIGTTAPAPSSIFHAVGVNDGLSYALFTSGADTGAAGTPDIRVGIATAAPDRSLHVASVGPATGGILISGTSPGLYLSNGVTANTRGMLGVASAADQFSTGTLFNDVSLSSQVGNLRFATIGGLTNPIVRMSIMNTGNVGIGTTTPSNAAPTGPASLDIVGVGDLFVRQAAPDGNNRSNHVRIRAPSDASTGIELRSEISAGNPYIDFSKNNVAGTAATSDYTMRMQLQSAVLPGTTTPVYDGFRISAAGTNIGVLDTAGDVIARNPTNTGNYVQLRAGSDNNTGIELHSGTGGNPYIDFAQTSADFNARIRLAGLSGTIGNLNIENARLGIDVAVPEFPLHVNGQVLFAHVDPQVILRETDRAANARQWKIVSNNGAFRIAVTNDADTSFSSAIEMVRGSPSPIGAIFFTSNVGQVVIGRNDTSQFAGKFFVEGTAAKTTAGAWAGPSDARLKTDIQPLTGALEKMLALRGVTFQWKDPEKMGDMPGRHHMGMVGQEVEKVFPDWIEKNPEGIRILAVEGFEGLTAEAFKELKQQNDQLRDRLDAQEKELQLLKKQMEGAGQSL